MTYEQRYCKRKGCDSAKMDEYFSFAVGRPSEWRCSNCGRSESDPPGPDEEPANTPSSLLERGFEALRRSLNPEVLSGKNN
jgi:hypothetical protein